MTDRSTWLRPSALPKLKLCGHYRSEPIAGDAAARGTRMDVVFREAFSGEPLPDGFTMEEGDRQSLVWSVDTALGLSVTAHIETRESHLRVEALGLSGTMDALCSSGNWSLDLKTGQERNYREQQALYALGCMDSHFTDEWTVYLLFCDLRKVVTLRFTRQEAEECARIPIAKALAAEAGEEPPTPNEYCGWCAKRWTCDARREALGIVPMGVPDAPDLQMQPSELLREFVLRAKVIEDFAAEAKRILLDRNIGGEKVPGVSRSGRSGARELPASALVAHVREMGVERFLEMLGPLSEDKARAITAQVSEGIPFPADAVIQKPGSTFIVCRKPKALKA